MLVNSTKDLKKNCQFFSNSFQKLKRREHFQTHFMKTALPMGFPSGSAVKNPSAMQEKLETWIRSVVQGRFPGERHDNSLQYSCLENPMDRGAWQATVHRVTKSRTRLKQWSMHYQYESPTRTLQEKNIRLIFLMNTDAKTLSKVSVNHIQLYIKKIRHHDQVGFIPRTQAWFKIGKSINVIHNYVGKNQCSFCFSFILRLQSHSRLTPNVCGVCPHQAILCDTR